MPILCLVTDVEVAGGDSHRLADIVAAAVRGGVNMVQVRAPAASDHEFVELIGLVSGAVDGAALVVANAGGRDRLPSVRSVDGYHLPESEVGKTSGLFDDVPTGTVIGASAHSAHSALVAATAGADYVILGTLFATESHPGVELQGLPLVRSVTAQLRVPVLGIGGIASDTAAAVIGAGASGVAVIRAVAAAPEPCDAARELSQIIQSAWADARER